MRKLDKKWRENIKLALVNMNISKFLMH